MLWCVVFFYIGTQQPISVSPVCALSKPEAERLASDMSYARMGIHAVVYPQAH